MARYTRCACGHMEYEHVSVNSGDTCLRCDCGRFTKGPRKGTKAYLEQRLAEMLEEKAQWLNERGNGGAPYIEYKQYQKARDDCYKALDERNKYIWRSQDLWCLLRQMYKKYKAIDRELETYKLYEEERNGQNVKDKELNQAYTQVRP